MKFLGLLAVLVLVSCGIQSHASDVNQQKNMKQIKLSREQVSNYVPDELLVKFASSVSEAAAKKLIVAQGASVITRIKQQGVYHIRLPEGQDAQQQIKTYQRIQGVDFVELNYTRDIK